MRKLCFGLLLATLMGCAFMSLHAQTVSIGTGTSSTLSTGTGSTSLQSPYNSYYGYSYVQTIYLQSEIMATGSITSIRYYFAGSSVSNSDQVKIYMGHVARSAFSSTTDWEPLANLTLVFDGVISGTLPGWITIDLPIPFPYNNTANLLIAVDENKAGDNGTAGYRASDLGSNRVIFYRSDTNDPDPTAPPTANGRSSYVGNIEINGLTLAGCRVPTSVSVGSIVPGGATPAWSAPAGGDAVSLYDWELRTSGAGGSGATGLVQNGSTAATNIPLSGLTGGTNYTFYVRSNCGSATSTWVAAETFSTPLTIPWTEPFTATGAPSGWTTTGWTIDGTSSAGGNPGNAIFRNLYSSAASGTFSTPVIGVVSAGDELKLDYRHANYDAPYAPPGAGSGSFIVAISTNGGGTYTDLETISNDAVAGWRTKVYPLGAYVGQSVKVRITAARTSGDYYLAFDNFSIAQAPACPSPSSINFSNITEASADVTFVSAGNNFIVEYGPPGFTPGTGATADGGTIVTGTASPVALNSLAAGTSYDVYVRQVCSGPSYSANSSVAALATQACAPANQCNYTIELIDAYGDGWNGTVLGIRQAGALAGTFTLVDGGSGTAAIALCPGYSTEVVVTTLGSYTDEVAFVIKDPGGVVVFSRDYGSTFSGSTVFTTFTSQCPTCYPPVNLSATGITQTDATIQWSAPSTTSPGSYDLYYSTDPTTPLADATPNFADITATSQALGGLTQGTTYYVWLRSNCGGSDKSLWTPLPSFNTRCPATTIPYAENFDGVTAPAVPVCLVIENVNGGSAWANGAVSSAASTPNSAYYQYDPALPADDWLFLRGLTLTGGQSYRLKFTYRNTGGTSWVEKMEVKYGTQPLSSAMTGTALFDNGNIDFNTNQTITLDFTPVATGDYYIGFHAYSDADQGTLILDDVSVELTPSCLPPTGLSATDHTEQGATLNWSAPATTSPSAYEIYYAATSTPAPDGTTVPQVTDITGVTHTLTGLSANTLYYVWVRSSCGSSDKSTWAALPSFRTKIVNDDASGALLLTVNAACTGGSYSNEGATLGANEARVSCKGSQVAGSVVWFKFVAPASGFVKVSTDNASSGTLTDTRIALFSASDVNDYATFTSIACDDDNGALIANSSTLYAPDLTPGTTYYVAVDHWNGASSGTFCLTVSDVTTTDLSASGSCVAGQSLSSYYNNYTGWLSVTDNDGKLRALVRNTTGSGTGSSTYENSVTVHTGAVRQDGAGVAYLNRNYLINNADLANVDVRFFFLASELAALNAVDGTTLGTLGVSRQNGTTCRADFNGANGTPGFLSPVVSGSLDGGNVNWVQVTTPGFSNFYLNKVGTALPVEMIAFAGYRNGSRNTLTWKTSSEQNNAGFEVQRSLDGVNFSVIGFVNSLAAGGYSTGELQYRFDDVQPLSKRQVYRLRQVDINDRSKYSDVVIINGDVKDHLAVEGVFPNPATTFVNISVQSPGRTELNVVLTDLYGREIKRQQNRVETGSNTIRLEGTGNLSAGTYLVRLTDAGSGISVTAKFIKN